MKIIRKSTLTGRIRLRWVDMTPEQMDAYDKSGNARESFPHLKIDDLLFVQWGILMCEIDEAVPLID